MAGKSAPCDVCEGKGFQAEVLDLPVTAAIEHFAVGESRIPAVSKIIGHLAEVGLGYFSLGQPLTTLSGGERQRLKLATHLSAKTADSASVIILDEPTTGLHLADVETMLDSAGHDGGQIVFEGPPKQLVAAASRSHAPLTAQHLAAYVTGA